MDIGQYVPTSCTGVMGIAGLVVGWHGTRRCACMVCADIDRIER